MLVLVILAVSNLTGWALLAAPSQAAGGGLTVTVSLSPTSIPADGSSTSTATATVTGPLGGVSGDPVSFTSSDTQQKIGTVQDQGNGTYTATITSSTTVGTATITATDPAALSPSGTATLTQTAGPASAVGVTLSPTSVPADGSSTSTATATVTDAQHHPLSGETVAFSSTDPGQKFGPVQDHGNGTYTATITSSTTVGASVITATDASASASPSGFAILTQTAVASPPSPPVTTTTGPSPTPPPVTTTTTGPSPTPAPTPTPTSTTTLITAPTAPRTNQGVTLIATVTSSSGAASPSGTVSFESGGAVISRCALVPVATLMQSETVTCRTSFMAAIFPQPLVAVFTADPGSRVPGSTSATDELVVGRDSTSTALDVSNPTIKTRSRATYTATVASRHAGPAAPSGSVRFFDRGSPIASCVSRPLVADGGFAVARCTISYRKAGKHLITARYRGDAHFSGSRSSPAQPVSVREMARGTVTSTMRWTFYYTPAYTRVIALVVRHASVGTTVMVRCRGRGCPFAKRATAVTKRNRCGPRAKHRCSPKPATIDLVRSFRRHRLRAGAQLSVALTRGDSIGKSYVFKIRAGHPPRIQIRCLAPGGTRPGAHC